MRKRDERAHPVVQAAIEAGYLGTGRPYVVPGFTSREAANEGRKAINNACRHLGVSCRSREAEDIKQTSDGAWEVSFRIWAKADGRRHIHAQAGGDPANLAYNPFARVSGPSVDELGRPLGRP